MLGATEDYAALVYMVVSFTGPVSGVIVGGIVTSSLGGYNTRKGQLAQIFMAFAAIACSIPMPFFKSITWFSCTLFGLLFFGGALVPTVTGIMLNSVPENLRTTANSFAQVCYNSIGYLPAPLFYGTVSKIVNNPKSNVPFIALLSTTIFTITTLVLAIRAKIAKEDSKGGS